jgi:hypothetical protein
VTFSHRVALPRALTHDVSEVVAALEAVQPVGETALFDAMYAGLLAGVNDPSRSLVLAFSDGVDTASWLTAAQIIETAKRSDAVVYALSPEGRRLGAVPPQPRRSDRRVRPSRWTRCGSSRADSRRSSRNSATATFSATRRRASSRAAGTSSKFE